jgi:hypothetical protein
VKILDLLKNGMPLAELWWHYGKDDSSILNTGDKGHEIRSSFW